MRNFNVYFTIIYPLSILYYFMVEHLIIYIDVYSIDHFCPYLCYIILQNGHTKPDLYNLFVKMVSFDLLYNAKKI